MQIGVAVAGSVGANIAGRFMKVGHASVVPEARQPAIDTLGNHAEPQTK
ncbi:MAG: hypothetical protein ABSC06_13980 [Rhodopila sp.]|jgi:6-phosphogluconate dehydrogenase (decarboxylating)